MRAVIQRVRCAAVHIAGKEVAAIGEGLVVFLGIGHGDTEEDADYSAAKTAELRIFEDEAGKMNRSVLDAGGQALVISQFTLYGDCRRGRRPSFTAAAPPDVAIKLYEAYVARLRALGVPTQTGEFAATMQVTLINKGPVTILLDSRKTF